MERCSCCQHGLDRGKNSVPCWSTSGQLLLAIQNCNIIWLKTLLSAPDKDFSIPEGNYMCQAAETGDAGIVLELLAAGANPNEKSVSLCKRRPIHICAEQGFLDCLEVLVSHGAHVNQQDSHKRTALHFAAQQGHEGSIKWLINHGALVDETDTDRYTPLNVAACLGYGRACEFLLALGGADVSNLSNDGWSPLHMATNYGHVEVVRILFSFGASAWGKTLEGETALHMACAKGFTDLAQILLDHGADIESCDNHGATPLHYAIYYGHLEVVYKLLKSGANIDSRSVPASSCPLNLAAVRGDHEMLHLLQRAGYVICPHVAAVMHGRNNISEQYRDEISKFPSLRDLSVWKIRGVLAPNLQSKAMNLPIPLVMKKLVVFHDLKIR
ncbi:ankyrin [Elysia marginata]|uniref:Ankyrin n=1 Tax=Elysia marginata TaxID=1093978 RepID=A0AAV4HLT3_9GAST|nr:ankyrin [Elysia marginata]